MTSTQSSIFVVGATGTVGRRLVRRLTDRGTPVRAATRTPSTFEGPEGADAVRFDYLDPETWSAALGNADRAFVLAPSDTEAYNQLVPFLDAAADADVEHVVLMTAMGVDQAPDEMPLRRAELTLMNQALGGTILRPNWFMQNFTTFWRGMIEANGVMRLPADDAATSFIDADDIAAVAEAALVESGHADEAYTLTGSEAFTYYETASILSEAWGRTVQYEPVDDEEAHRILTAAGLDDDYAEMLIGLFQNVRAGHAAPVTQAVRTVTGHAPRSLEDFAEATAETTS
jgi:uncharacterized protein YbjT (DUF2867 family)